MHSVNGSEKVSTWPDACQTSRAKITQESKPTTSSLPCTIDFHHWRLILFFNYLNSKYLGDPGVILIDKATGEVIYESGSTKARTPASVLKLTTAATIALTLDASTVFKTAIYKTEKRGVFVIWGENDPWITSNAKYRDANKRAYMPKLIKAAFASDKKLKKITLIYKGVNNSDFF